MADAKLVRLLEDLYRATTTFGADPSAVNRERYDAAFDAIVAHVREREVELMGFGMFARNQVRPLSLEQTVAAWRGLSPEIRNQWFTVARALRDAFDQAGAPREGER